MITLFSPYRQNSLRACTQFTCLWALKFRDYFNIFLNLDPLGEDKNSCIHQMIIPRAFYREVIIQNFD